MRYARPTSPQGGSKRNGRGDSTSHADRGKRPSTVQLRAYGGAERGPARRCPTCELDVPTNLSGALVRHRLTPVGQPARNGWACPGEEAPVN